MFELENSLVPKGLLAWKVTPLRFAVMAYSGFSGELSSSEEVHEKRVKVNDRTRIKIFFTKVDFSKLVSIQM